MQKIVWLESAIDDAARLHAFIVEENPDAAKRMAETIKLAIKRLADTPHIGKPVLDLAPYRDLLIRFGAGGYVLRYREDGGAIYIVHLRHYREIDYNLI